VIDLQECGTSVRSQTTSARREVTRQTGRDCDQDVALFTRAGHKRATRPASLKRRGPGSLPGPLAFPRLSTSRPVGAEGSRHRRAVHHGVTGGTAVRGVDPDHRLHRGVPPDSGAGTAFPARGALAKARLTQHQPVAERRAKHVHGNTQRVTGERAGHKRATATGAHLLTTSRQALPGARNCAESVSTSPDRSQLSRRAGCGQRGEWATSRGFAAGPLLPEREGEPVNGWTTDPPTAPGWYWYRENEAAFPRILLIASGVARSLCVKPADPRAPATEADLPTSGEWMGPLDGLTPSNSRRGHN
jgi:hypothetical protein